MFTQVFINPIICILCFTTQKQENDSIYCVRFYSMTEEDEEEDSSGWLTQQVVSSLSSLPGLNTDLQTDYLQV